jgi:hypothetical protein
VSAENTFFSILILQCFSKASGDSVMFRLIRVSKDYQYNRTLRAFRFPRKIIFADRNVPVLGTYPLLSLMLSQLADSVTTSASHQTVV